MSLKEKIDFWLDILVRPDDISSDPIEIISKSDKISGKSKKELSKNKLEAEKILDEDSVDVINPIVEKVVQSRVQSHGRNTSKARGSNNKQKDDELEL